MTIALIKSITEMEEEWGVINWKKTLKCLWKIILDL
jgi:hypothetical protein